MAKMYSHEAVMKLLETQRKSIMEFEAAKYELMMGGEQKPVEAVSQRRVDSMESSLKRANLQLRQLRDCNRRRLMRDRMNRLNKLKGQPKKWTAENIHLEIHRIMMEASRDSNKAWIQWVRKYALTNCQSMRDYKSMMNLRLTDNWRTAYKKQIEEPTVVFLQSVIREWISLK